MSLDNKQQMEILKNAVKEGYRGSYTELWTAADPETQQENVEVAETPQQQEQGLGGRAAQDMPDAMVFPESQGDFNTTDMQAPIDIEKYGPQGDLVQSYKSVPPGINNLPMGDDVGTVIERPAEYKEGGFFKNVKVNTRKKGGFYQTDGVKDYTDQEWEALLDQANANKQDVPLGDYQETDSLGFIPKAATGTNSSDIVLDQLRDNLDFEEKESLQNEVTHLQKSVKSNLKSDSSITDILSFAKNLDLSKVVNLRDKGGVSQDELRNMAYSLIPGYSDMSWVTKKLINGAMNYKGLKQGGFKNVEVNTRKK